MKILYNKKWKLIWSIQVTKILSIINFIYTCSIFLLIHKFHSCICNFKYISNRSSWAFPNFLNMYESSVRAFINNGSSQSSVKEEQTNQKNFLFLCWFVKILLDVQNQCWQYYFCNFNYGDTYEQKSHGNGICRKWNEQVSYTTIPILNYYSTKNMCLIVQFL